MKHTGLVLGAVLCGFMFATPTLSGAQETRPQVFISSGGAPATDLAMGDYQAWDQFSQEHPDIIRELSRNPHLIDSPQFASRHPEWRDFLDSHGDLRAAIMADPGNYLVVRPANRTPRWTARNRNERPNGSNARGNDANTTAFNAPSANAGAGTNGASNANTNGGNDSSMANAGAGASNAPLENTAGPNSGDAGNAPAANTGATNPSVPPDAPAGNGAPGAPGTPVNGAPNAPIGGGPNASGAAQ